MNRVRFLNQVILSSLEGKSTSKWYRFLFSCCLGIAGIYLSVPVKAVSDPMGKCQGALSKHRSDGRQQTSFQTTNESQFIDELVDLSFDDRAKVSGSSPWSEINKNSLIGEKRAEIERVLGKEVARQIYNQVQSRVAKKILAPENQGPGDRGLFDPEVSERSRKVQIFKPIFLRTVFQYLGSVKSAVFSPDGSQVLIAPFNSAAKLVDVETGQLLQSFEGHDAPLSSAVFSPDGSQVLTASRDATAKLWDSNSGKLLQTFSEHSGWLHSARFSPDGSQVLTASKDQTAKLWDVKTGKVIHTFEGHTKAVLSAVFSPKGSQVLTASEDSSAKLWDIKSGRVLRTFKGHGWMISSAVFTHDGLQVLTAGNDNTAKLKGAKTGKLIQTFKGHKWPLNSANFSPSGTTIITASFDSEVKLWDVASGELLHTFDLHRHSVNSAEFSSDGSRVLTASADGTVKLWSLYCEDNLDYDEFEGWSKAGKTP